MRPRAARLRRGVALLPLWLLCCVAAPDRAGAQKPLLSEEIHKLLEREGAAAAQRRFDELYPGHKDRFDLDLKGFAALAMQYSKAGDQAKAQLILGMSSAITRDMITAFADSMPTAPKPSTPDPAAQPAAKQSRTREPDPDLGPARKDLDRFRGLYGVPGKNGSRRDLFVTVSCDGYLVVGAMWGDTSNWWMKSVSEYSFEMSDSFMSLHLQFVPGPGGTPSALKHDLQGLPSPLPRVGPLPDGWEACVFRERGR